MGGTANWRTDLYSGPTSGTLLTHRESIELFTKLGVMMTPELKSPAVPMPFDGFTQQACAQKMIDEYKAARVSPRHVFAQSFDKNDVLYWVRNEPKFGKQAVYLDDANTPAELPSASELRSYKADGINIWALERSGILADGGNGFYYQTYDTAIWREGDTMRVLDVLANEVGILGVFSDWPATVTYFANCMGLK